MASSVAKGILMSNLMSPFFVFDGNDLVVLATLKGIQLELEAIDVKHGIYDAFDAQGRRLRLETDGKNIKISLGEEGAVHANELETRLRKYLIAMKEERASDLTCDLNCLVEISKKYMLV
jgi:hypothetical protein